MISLVRGCPVSSNLVSLVKVGHVSLPPLPGAVHVAAVSVVPRSAAPLIDLIPSGLPTAILAEVSGQGRQGHDIPK